MLKSIIFFFSLVVLSWAEINPYENFQNYMNSADGRKLSLSVFILDSENNSRYEGTLYYSGDKHYSFYSEAVGIVFGDGIIKTINRDTEQIIYDKVVGSNLSVLDILCGTQGGLDIDEITSDRNNYKIEFSVEEWDMTGALWVKNSGEPMKVTVGTSEDYQIVVNINPFDWESEEKILFTDTSEYEIIDLRE